MKNDVQHGYLVKTETVKTQNHSPPRYRLTEASYIDSRRSEIRSISDRHFQRKTCHQVVELDSLETLEQLVILYGILGRIRLIASEDVLAEAEIAVGGSSISMRGQT